MGGGVGSDRTRAIAPLPPGHHRKVEDCLCRIVDDLCLMSHRRVLQKVGERDECNKCLCGLDPFFGRFFAVSVHQKAHGVGSLENLQSEMASATVGMVGWVEVGGIGVADWSSNQSQENICHYE